MQVLRGAAVFDGLGNPSRALDVLVQDGVVAALLPPGAELGAEIEAIDVRGCWVMPGFIDLHTHYDAEIELWPALGESVRHGVTTIFLGSCGLSMAIGEPDALADMLCATESPPR